MKIMTEYLYIFGIHITNVRSAHAGHRVVQHNLTVMPMVATAAAIYLAMAV